MRRTRRPKLHRRPTGGPSTPAGTSSARRCSRDRRRWASCRAGTACPTVTPDVAAWERSRGAMRGRCSAACRRSSPGSPSHTDAQIGRLVEFLEQTALLDNTLFVVHVRQRRQRRGRRVRLRERVSLLSGPAGHARGEHGGDRPISVARGRTTTIRQAGRRPATRRSRCTRSTPSAAASARR